MVENNVHAEANAELVGQIRELKDKLDQEKRLNEKCMKDLDAAVKKYNEEIEARLAAEQVSDSRQREIDSLHSERAKRDKYHDQECREVAVGGAVIGVIAGALITTTIIGICAACSD